ncbi:hypothetical protein POM88_042185 [Heracleum sosnowskyi]|uniref:Uncharacterized protein n=1 Tax=Heracleum sosnowskyi TaxID=360622 RepID=A0AAD8HG97_9APIA|nr:hypothetical protein POM88_042185 [Heracleum sosnowskyi]
MHTLSDHEEDLVEIGSPSVQPVELPFAPVPVQTTIPWRAASVDSRISILGDPAPIFLHAHVDLARDLETLSGQNAELQALVDQMSDEADRRVAITEAEWQDRIRTVEESARKRLAEEPVTVDALEEARRVTRIVSWMLCEPRAVRGGRD